MRVIKSLNDISKLETAHLISPFFSQLLRNDFNEKAREAIFPAKIPEPDFEIDEFGYLVILEAGDNPEEWSYHGLKINSSKIGIQPEYAEVINVSSTELYYRIVLFADNDYIMYYYSPIGIHSPNIEEWFESLVS